MLRLQRDSALIPLSFHRLPDGEAVALFSCVGIQEKEKDNEENGSLKDCLAQSESTSASPTLGADQPGFGNGTLSGSGIGFWRLRIVLDDDVELAIRPRWASRLELKRGAAQTATVQPGTTDMNLDSMFAKFLKILFVLGASITVFAQTAGPEHELLPQPGSKQYWLVVDEFADRVVHLAYAKRFAQLHEPLTNRQCQQYSRIAVDYVHQLATVKRARVSSESGFWNDVRDYSTRMIGPTGVSVPVHRTSSYRVTTGSDAEDHELLRILMLEIDETRSHLLPTVEHSPVGLAAECQPAIEAMIATSGQ